MAELAAIKFALDHILSLPIPPHSSIHILSDSQFAVISSISGHTNPHSSTYWLTIKNIKRQIYALSLSLISVIIDWVPGHCGLLPNSIADHLANNGNLTSRSHPTPSPVHIPYSLKHFGK
jgi:ribonuclease HI